MSYNNRNSDRERGPRRSGGNYGAGGGRDRDRRDPYYRPGARDDRRGDLLAPTSANKESWPPQMVNIRGGFTLVISNLAKGTTADDVKATFQRFGEITDVQLRPPPSANYPSMAYEVTYVLRPDAEAAMHAFHGAVADGRLLGVAFKPANDAVRAQALPTSSIAMLADDESPQLPLVRAQVPAPSLTLAPEERSHKMYSTALSEDRVAASPTDPPTGPRRYHDDREARYRQEHQDIRAYQQSAQQYDAVPRGGRYQDDHAPQAHSSGGQQYRQQGPPHQSAPHVKPVPTRSLAERLGQGAKGKPLPGKGPAKNAVGKGGAVPPGSAGQSLLNRIGSLPLAQRLSIAADKAGAKSDAKLLKKPKGVLAKKAATPATKKANKKKKGGAAKADGKTKESAMEVD